MRGVISGAMLMELKRYGLHSAVDAIYGASAGAINATYYITGQHAGLNAYVEDLVSPQFLNVQGLVKGQPVMNLDYLLDHVMHIVKPLNWDSVLSSAVELKVVASSLDRLQPVILDRFTCRHDLIECLKASATVPHIAGPPRLVRGERLVDAAVFEPVPVESAIRDGCTHVIVLCTRTKQSEKGWRRHLQRTLVKTIKRKLLSQPRNLNIPGFQSETNAWLQRAHVVDDLMAAAVATCPYDMQRAFGAFVLPIFPSTTCGLHPLCTKVDLLRSGMAEGAATVQKVVTAVWPEKLGQPHMRDGGSAVQDTLQVDQQ